MIEQRSLDSAALHASAVTLARATAFLRAGHGGPFRARALANGLRELDRFLSVLIDEAASIGLAGRLEQAELAKQRNTPNKLRGFRAALGLDSPDHERLRAIGRSRERLFHSAAPRDGEDSRFVPGWLRMAGLDGRRPAEAEPLSSQLSRICRLYDRLAGELLVACEPHDGAEIDFRDPLAYLQDANVACDGISRLG